MTEARIVELLYSLNKKEDNLPKNAQFIPEYINIVSKNLASYIYQSNKTQSSSITTKRLDLINVLQKWSFKETTHFNIEESNIDCFLATLNNPNNNSKYISNEEQDAFIEEFKKELEVKYKQNSVDFLTEVSNFYKELKTKNIKRNEEIDEIIKFESLQFTEDNFDFTYPTRIRKEEDFDEFLSKFLENDCVNKTEEKTVVETIQYTARYRESQIQAAYGVLNLPKNNETEKYFIILIHRLKSFKQLNEEEIKFIEYFFIKCDTISTNFTEKLLENFPFIYERAIIKLCTDSLKEESNTDVNSLDSKVSKKLQQLSKSSSTLKVKLIKIVYELFALSNYNESVLKVIESIT